MDEQSRFGLRRRVLIDVSVGGIIGYFILHPVAMFIKDVAEPSPHLHWNAFRESLTLHHLPMALYFVMFGGLFVLIVRKNSTRNLLRIQKVPTMYSDMVSPGMFLFGPISHF